MQKNIIFIISFIFIAVALFFIKSPSVLAATLSLSPASGSYVVGNNFNVVVTLNTAGANTDGVDLHYLRFNRSLLRLESVSLGNLYPNTLTNTINNTNGTYDFSQTTAGGARYVGSGTLLTLTFSVLSAGTVDVSFDYTSGSGLDCNVASGGSDVLSGVTNGSYTLTALPDTTAPAAVTNLAASNPTANSITLTWTAPGDDGSSGTAASYDLRYSTSQIIESNWASATQVVNEPNPLAAGASQSMGVTGLFSDTTYYFAIKTSDEVPNTSAISNSPSARTSDSAAPATVSNLTASNPTTNSITLAWTAPGDNGATGTAVSYDIRYAASQITDANWVSASQVVNEPAPKTAGSAESFVVAGLSSNTAYYFALRTADEMPLWSGTSNSPLATTTGLPDTTAPSTVANLAASNPTANSITLTWTAPGDDGGTGTAASYDIRYSTAQISESNWASASQVANEPAPLTAGFSQSMGVPGLSSNTTYYFAIKTSDEVPNTSAISNSPSAQTSSLPDTTPPQVSNIQAAGITNIDVTITWTTDEPATSQVEYGTSASYGQATNLNTGLVTSHSVAISGLSAATDYHFRVKSKDAADNEAISNDYTFTTTGGTGDTTAPQISNVQASGITAIDGLITWTTDEPATSQVEYGTSASYGASTNLDTNLATNHTVSLYSLTASTLYHFRVKSKDAADNEAISNDYTFTSAGSTDNGGGGGGGGGGGNGGGNGGGTSYPNGSLLKAPDNKIYLLDNQQKRWIISLEAFESCNYNWDSVKVVSQAVIDQYQDGYNFYGCPHEIILLKSPDHPAVYQISKSTKRHLPSIEVFESYGYPWTDIQVVSQTALDAYPRTELIKTDADPKAYYFSTTRTRRWLPSSEIFDAYGFDWAKLVIINETEMAVYPDCRVIKTAASPDVYQLSGTVKRKITSTQAYETLGYRWEDINVVSQQEFDFYTTGEPYSI